MHTNLRMLPQNLYRSSFLSCEKDCELILRKLFIESKPYSEDLIRLLVVNSKDCLDNKNSKTINDIVNNMTLEKLIDQSYVRLSPKLLMHEHEEIKSYILVTFNNFFTSKNPEFRDCTVTFDVICHTDYWDLGNFRMRPLKICGYIDGILNNTKLTGIGTFQFAGCTELVLDENLSGYSMMFNAVHGVESDDKIEFAEILNG